MIDQNSNTPATDIFAKINNTATLDELGVIEFALQSAIKCARNRISPPVNELYAHVAYPVDVAAKVEKMGSLAVSVANRWMLGWPERVELLLAAGTYLSCLETQVDQEKDILANEANLRHLSRREILQMYEIKESPPC